MMHSNIGQHSAILSVQNHFENDECVLNMRCLAFVVWEIVFITWLLEWLKIMYGLRASVIFVDLGWKGY